MRNLLVILTLTVIAGIFGCQKKDDAAPAGPPGCPPAHVFASYTNTCIPIQSCPTGLVINQSQPSMCVDPRTGQNIQTQQCGAGFFLTAQGCFPQGTCPSGQAARDQYSCIQVISGSQWGGTSGQPTNYQYNGGYQQQQYPGGYSQPYYPGYYYRGY